MNQVSRQLRTKSFPIGAVLGATLLLCLTAMLAVAPAALSAPSRAPYVVVLKDDVAHPANVAHRHEENRGARISHIYGIAIKGYSATLTPGAVKAIRKDPNVDYVESDGVIRPKGQVVGTQLKRVQVNQNPQVDIDGADDARVNVDIAILDTGVAQHPDLNVVSRVNCVEYSGAGPCKAGQADDDKSGHGTHVAGDAAAIDNGIGVVGTAPGARIWSVKVVNKMEHIGSDEVGMSFTGALNGTNLKDGNALMSDAIAGINWVTINSSQIEVANMSFTCATDEGGCARTALKEAIATSVNNGVVWVAAAGQEGLGVANNAYNIRHYPALLSDVITVSAMADYDGLPGSKSNSNGCPLEKGSQHDDRLMGESPESSPGYGDGGIGSNYGPEVDITAPGSCVFSTWSPYVIGYNRYGNPLASEYGVMYGSSVASGLVAGAAADIASQYNPNNRADVEKIRAALLGVGHYDWEDLVNDGFGNFISPDGYKEPLLNLSTTPFAIPPTSPPPPTPGPPTVAPGSVTKITETSAELSASINPQGQDGRYRFECALVGSSSYTLTSPEEGLYFKSGTSPVVYSWTQTGLTPGASYHCRMAAWNIGNILNPVYTPDMPTFTTPKYSASYVAPGAPAPLVQDNGNIDVFALKSGTDELDYTRALSGSWSVTNLTPPGQPKMSGGTAVLRMKVGAMHAFVVNKVGDIICHYRTGTEPWNYINLSAYAGATMKFDNSTTPSAVEWGPNRVGVYARATNGDLVSLERRADGTWFTWNETEKTPTHPQIEGSPTAVVLDNPSNYANTDLIVFGRNSSYHLMTFNRSTSGNWTSYDVSANTGVSITAPPAALQLDPNLYAGSGLDAFARDMTGNLVEFSRATSGVWTVYNVTQNLPSPHPYILGTVAPIRLSPNLYAGSGLGVYAQSGNGDLIGFDRAPSGGWSVYNVSATNGFPGIYGSPAVVALNPNLYAGSGLEVHALNNKYEAVSYDRSMDGGWSYYNETANAKP